jgi:hypothetical protein
VNQAAYTPSAGIAEYVAAHHHALHPMRAAQRLGSGDHVSGIHTGADVGRGVRHRLVAVGLGRLGDQRQRIDREAEPFTGLAQQLHIAGRLLPEGEVVAHDDLDDVQPFDEQFVDVALRGELHEVRRERHDQKDVDAHLLDQLRTPGQRGQLRRVTTGKDDLHRVRIEGHQHGGHATGPARFHRAADQLLMPSVDTVEHADGDDTSAPVRRDLTLASPALHSRSLRPDVNAGPPAPPDQVMIA